MTVFVVEVTCPGCGVRRLRKSTNSQLSEAFCRSCANSRAQRRRGHVAPREITCVVCGRTFMAKGYRINPKFCSHKCHGEAMREGRSGDSNPNFRHGLKNGRQIRGWSVADKGEFRCRLCGATELLALHHIIPRGKWKAGRQDLRNGMVLCFADHARWHRGRRELTKDLFTDEEWEFVSSAQLVGEVTEAWLERHYPTRPML